MSSPAPSAHAARAGAWALIVVLATDLVFEMGRRLLPMLATDPEASPDFDWFRWLNWFADSDLPLQAMLVAIAAVALLRLRRGTADAGAKAMFLGSGLLLVLELGWMAAYRLLVEDDAASMAAWARTFVLVATLVDRLAAGLLLAAVWRARRAWGHGVGMAWSFAALLFVLQLALFVGMSVLGPSQVDHDTFLRRGLMLLAFSVTDIGAQVAMLFAYARVAPSEPASQRFTAAAAGLDTYFRALVTRVTIVVVGGVVTLAFGLTSPAARAKLLLFALALAVPTVVAQVAGLTRYADAPARIGRGALGVALTAIGAGLVVEVMTLTMFAEMIWPDELTGFGRHERQMLQYAGTCGQIASVVGATALLVSLRRAAITLESPALQRRAAALGASLIGVVAATAALVGLFGETLARTPLALLGIGVVALVLGVTMFIWWLRLIEGVAQELRARAKVA